MHTELNKQIKKLLQAQIEIDKKLKEHQKKAARDLLEIQGECEKFHQDNQDRCQAQTTKIDKIRKKTEAHLASLRGAAKEKAESS
jgi:hypothetical protein